MNKLIKFIFLINLVNHKKNKKNNNQKFIHKKQKSFNSKNNKIKYK